MGDLLFSTVEKFNGEREWGRFLDAGTGVHSLRWIQSLPTSGWTAITADQGMRRNIEMDPLINLRPSDSLVVGNWMDEEFCESLGTYDTILADYLFGAVDGFSPYEQDTIVFKLAKRLNPGGKLFVVGMNPIPDHADAPADLIGEVRRARDSCILLAGHKPYREFPLSWMKRHLERAGIRAVRSKNFTILHSEESVGRQIRVAFSKLPLMPIEVRAGTEKYLTDLQNRCNAAIQKTTAKRIPLSFDYVIHAELGREGSSNGEGEGAAAADDFILEALEGLNEEDIVDMQKMAV